MSAPINLNNHRLPSQQQHQAWGVHRPCPLKINAPKQHQTTDPIMKMTLHTCANRFSALNSSNAIWIDGKQPSGKWELQRKYRYHQTIDISWAQQHGTVAHTYAASQSDDASNGTMHVPICESQTRDTYPHHGACKCLSKHHNAQAIIKLHIQHIVASCQRQ